MKPKLKKPLIGLGIFIAIVVVFVVASMLKGEDTHNKYFSKLYEVLNKKDGYYKYTLTVLTEDKTENTAVKEVEEDTNAKPRNEFQDWNKYSETKVESWKDPNYTVEIEGNTLSSDPYKSNFKVTLATPTHKGIFTEVYLVDGFYYIDVDSMYKWLESSKDGYLKTLTSLLPDGIKWYKIADKELLFYSNYAEGGEKAYSETTGLGLKQKITSTLLLLANRLELATSKDNMVKEDNVLSVVQNDKNVLYNTIRNLVANSGYYYDSFVQSMGYSDKSLEQADREKDNFIESLLPLHTALQNIDINNSDFKFNGSMREFTNSNNSPQTEIDLVFNYTGEKTHKLGLSIISSSPNKTFETPDGSTGTVDLKSFNKLKNDLIAYFNPTPIKIPLQLEITPDTILDDVLYKFSKLGQSLGESITRGTALEYIKTNKGQDNIGGKLVRDLVLSLTKITSGTNKDTPKDKNKPEVERFPKLETTFGGLSYTFKYNEEDSDSRIHVVDVEVINKTDTPYMVNDSYFSLRSLLNSTYPANNELLLKDINNLFDTKLLIKEKKLKPKHWLSFKLYIVNTEELEHLDMYIKDTKIGSIVEY